MRRREEEPPLLLHLGFLINLGEIIYNQLQCDIINALVSHSVAAAVAAGTATTTASH